MEPDSTRLRHCLAVAWRVMRRSARRGVVPDIITIAWAAVCGAPGRHHIKPGSINRGRAACINQNIRTPLLTPILCGVIVCVAYVRNSNR